MWYFCFIMVIAKTKTVCCPVPLIKSIRAFIYPVFNNSLLITPLSYLLWLYSLLFSFSMKTNCGGRVSM